MLFVSRQKKIESSLAEYRSQVALCLEIFTKTFRDYLHETDRQKLEQAFTQVYQAESKADDIRREVEVMMYSKALFPESRGDILGLLETMDKVPNQAESTVHMVLNQHIEIPAEYHGQLMQLVGICNRCVKVMLDGVEKLFTDFTNAMVTVGKIDELESEADNIEEAIIERIFSSQMDGFQKLLIRDLIKKIATICDRAENVGDRMRIIVANRSI